MWTLENYADVRMNIKNFTQKNWQKISAASMAVKLVTVVGLFALVPMDTAKVHRESYKTAVKLDTANPLTLTNNRQVAVTSGESNYDATKKTYTRLAYANTNTSYVSASRDPQSFKDLYQKAASQYGIPWQLLAAVHYVESGASDSTGKASYAGAQGPMQFMPGTWRSYGVDGDGDGNADITNVNDAVYGAANYLAAGGAAEGNIDAALFNYNHAQWYVDKVRGVADSITW